MATGKKTGSKGGAVSAVSKPGRSRSTSKRTRSKAAAKLVVGRRQVLAFGMAAAAASLVPLPTLASTAVTHSTSETFIASAKQAIKLVDEWRRFGDEIEKVEAALKTMERGDSRRGDHLRRINDLPIERFRAALIADDALRSTMRMKIAGRKEAAIRDTLLLSLMEMTGKRPPVLNRELGLAT